MNKASEFEALWEVYVAKLARIDELKAKGRHGYQLCMPRKSLRIAGDKLRAFCTANGLKFPGS